VNGACIDLLAHPGFSGNQDRIIAARPPSQSPDRAGHLARQRGHRSERVCQILADGRQPFLRHQAKHQRMSSHEQHRAIATFGRTVNGESVDQRTVLAA